MFEALHDLANTLGSYIDLDDPWKAGLKIRVYPESRPEYRKALKAAGLDLESRMSSKFAKASQRAAAKLKGSRRQKGGEVPGAKLQEQVEKELDAMGWGAPSQSEYIPHVAEHLFEILEVGGLPGKTYFDAVGIKHDFRTVAARRELLKKSPTVTKNGVELPKCFPCALRYDENGDLEKGIFVWSNVEEDDEIVPYGGQPFGDAMYEWIMEEAENEASFAEKAEQEAAADLKGTPAGASASSAGSPSTEDVTSST